MKNFILASMLFVSVASTCTACTMSFKHGLEACVTVNQEKGTYTVDHQGHYECGAKQ